MQRIIKMDQRIKGLLIKEGRLHFEFSHPQFLGFTNNAPNSRKIEKLIPFGRGQKAKI
jgi:hypothetical protein